MDLNQYQKEINHLEHEMAGFNQSHDSDVSGSLGKFWKYKVYMMICLGVLIFLAIAKPKVILKLSETNPPEIMVDKKKLILYWIFLSFLSSLVYWIYRKVKPKESILVHT